MGPGARTEIGTGILCDLGCMGLHLSPCLGNELLGEIQELGHLHHGQELVTDPQDPGGAGKN